MISYRLRLFGRLVGELEIESDNFEITLNQDVLDEPETRLIWGETEDEINAAPQLADGHAADA